MRDRRVIAVIGAGVAVVAVILVVVFAAIQPIPEFAALDGSGETGFVAYVRDDGGGPGAIVIVDLGSETSVTYDVGRDGEAVGWDEDGNLVVVEWAPSAERFTLVDPTTGSEVGELDMARGQSYIEEREAVWIEHEDGYLVLERDRGDSRATFEAPDSYDVAAAAVMGADRIVFIDALGRVAVTGTGEGVVPVLVADDALEWWRVTGRDA